MSSAPPSSLPASSHPLPAPGRVPTRHGATSLGAGREEPEGNAKGGALHTHAGDREAPEFGLQLLWRHHPHAAALVVALMLVRRRVDKVVANELAARAEDSHGLGDRPLPVDDMVEHRKGQDDVKAAIIERQGG